MLPHALIDQKKSFYTNKVFKRAPTWVEAMRVVQPYLRSWSKQEAARFCK